MKPFWIFGIDRAVQNQVGAESYGLYFSLFSFSLLLNIFLDLGITNFNNRNIARYRSLLPKYLSNIFVIRIILAIVYAIISFTLAGLLGYNKAQINLLYFLVLNQFMLSFILYLRSNLSGLHYFKTDSILSVLDRLLMIGICSILLWNKHLPPIRIEWFIYAQSIAYFITLIVAFFLVLSKAPYFRPRFQLKYFVVILKQSYPC